jgi:hypothetical protein
VARAALVLGSAGLVSCAKPLFPENAPRTQFDNFEATRSGTPPAEEPDVFAPRAPDAEDGSLSRRLQAAGADRR